MTDNYSVGSLCTGYGGLEMGVAQAFGTFIPKFVADIDKASRVALDRWFPGVPNLGDITTVDWHAVPRIDLLAGGTPCQDVSNAGKRAGFAPGTRSGLWSAMADAIEILEPTYVVWENVKGARSARAVSGDVVAGERQVGEDGKPLLRALGRVLGDLSSLGYDAGWLTLPASDAGAPHRRERVFVLAWRRDASHAVGQLRERARVRRQDGWFELINGGSGLLPTPTVVDMGNNKTLEQWAEWTAKMRGRHGNGNGHGRSLSIEARSPEFYARYGAAVKLWENVLNPPAPSPVDSKGRLNTRFVEWMMGLPEGRVTDLDISRSAQLRLLGNGVVPQQAALALNTILERIPNDR